MLFRSSYSFYTSTEPKRNDGEQSFSRRTSALLSLLLARQTGTGSRLFRGTQGFYFAIQADLRWRLSSPTLQRLRDEAGRLATSAGPQGRAFLDAVRDSFARISPWSGSGEAGNLRSVFLSYRFAEKEYVGGLSRLLAKHQFEVVTGQSSNTFVSRSVIDRIRRCAFFLSLMTCADAKADGTFTTSPWLLEEKGVALAFGKPLVLMAEEGVSDFGGLQGDWQRIHFGAKGFLTAALEAVGQLQSYVGAG